LSRIPAILVLALTVLILGVTTHQTITLPLGYGRPDTLTLRVSTAGDAAASEELWLRELLIDGRSYRRDPLDDLAEWQSVTGQGDASSRSLRLRSGVDSAILPLYAGTVVLSGVASRQVDVRLGQNDVTVARMIRHPGDETEFFLVYPERQRAAAVFLSSMVVFGIIAWRLGTSGDWRLRAGWLALAIGVLHLLYWASQPVGTANDSGTYLAEFADVVDGAPGFFPPGYPLFLGLLDQLPGEATGAWVTLAQHGMVVASAVLVYLMLRRMTSDLIAQLGALMTGLAAPVLVMAQTVMSEVPTLFAMLVALYAGVRYAESGRLRWGIAAGIFTGFSGLLRVVPLAGLLPAAALLHLRRPGGLGWRRLGLTVGTAAVVLAIPVAWYWARSGSASLTNSTGMHLFNRVVTEQRLLDESAPATRRLLAALGGQDPRGLPHWIVTGHSGLGGMEEREEDLLLGTVAWEGIRRNPLAFVLYTPGLLWRNWHGNPLEHRWIPRAGETEGPIPALESRPFLPPGREQLQMREWMEKVYRLGWPVVRWLAIGGLVIGLLHPRRDLTFALAVTAVGYLLVTALIEYHSPRYNVAVFPFVMALALLPVSLGIRAMSLRASPHSSRSHPDPLL
jgi:4-amino-4-deoxy-L-arabinose transferase-like glycosyltransferase